MEKPWLQTVWFAIDSWSHFLVCSKNKLRFELLKRIYIRNSPWKIDFLKQFSTALENNTIFLQQFFRFGGYFLSLGHDCTYSQWCREMVDEILKLILRFDFSDDCKEKGKF